MFTFISTFMQKKLFYQIDILSPSPILYVYKEKRRPSYLGVILTILMIAITLIFSYNVIIKWINYSSFTITYNKIILQESSIFYLNETLFAFNSDILNTESNYSLNINLIAVNNESIESTFPITYNNCLHLTNYFCLNDSNINNISYTLNKETYLSFTISKNFSFNKSRENNIKNENDFDEEINIKFLFSAPKIDHNNFTNPINYVSFFHNYN